MLIPNAIKISNFVFNELTREKIRRENGLAGKHVIGHEQAVLRIECREQGDAAEDGAYDGTERSIKDGNMIHTVEKKRRCGFFCPFLEAR